ncbi:pinin/SDK/memA/ protein conserved region-domain-containing protein [Nemania sp. NC0429]|nr:pinin/SDK/memA/ protein conserved region-domain-containing protein [Nemania sp. NC0429]
MAVEDDSVNRRDADGKVAAESDPGFLADQSQDLANTTAQQKRKVSSLPSAEDTTPNSVKRAKVDSDKDDKRHDLRPQSAQEGGTDRRELARQEEKKRGRRLLGGLMNTLSQASAGSQHRKRQDIERRQQAKSTQQRAEEDRLRMQRLSKLEAVRRVEQIKFDEQVMKTRHTDLLAKARYLQTRANPKIFYLPYELTRVQENTIQDQIHQAEKTTEKEVSEFRERREERLQDLGIAVKPSIPNKDETVGKLHDEPPTADNPQPESTNRPASSATNKVGPEKPEKESDKADDVMIEEDEDTVIY